MECAVWNIYLERYNHYYITWTLAYAPNQVYLLYPSEFIPTVQIIILICPPCVCHIELVTYCLTIPCIFNLLQILVKYSRYVLQKRIFTHYNFLQNSAYRVIKIDVFMYTIVIRALKDNIVKVDDVGWLLYQHNCIVLLGVSLIPVAPCRINVYSIFFIFYFHVIIYFQ